MKAKLKEVEGRLITCLSWLLREYHSPRAGTCEFNTEIPNTKEGTTDAERPSVAIYSHYKEGNTIHITIENIDEINYPIKETVKEFWERLDWRAK